MVHIRRRILFGVFISFMLYGVCPQFTQAQTAYASNGWEQIHYNAQSNNQASEKIALKDLLSQLHQRYQLGFVYDGQIIKGLKFPIALLDAKPDQLIPDLAKSLQSVGLKLSKISNKQYGITRYGISKENRVNKSNSQKPGQIHVTGTVKDKLGNPLIGVTLKVKGKSDGTVTDVNGNFALDVLPTDSLIVSYVGYQTLTLAVVNQTNMDIILKAESGSLNEVVVVAYGEQKKASVTGAIATIQSKEIKQSPAANLTQTLAGRLPGLTDIQRSGQPGQDLAQLFIRGRGTTNSQSPIILVDGVERELTFLDPNEVASVTILKDASSTALFGVRGANGVILVTTKRGMSEKPVINFTAESGIEIFTRLAKPVNSYKYAVLQNQSLENDGLAKQFSDEAIAHYRKQDEPLFYPNTDFNRLLLKPYAPQNRYNLNISGKSGKVGYFVNAGYLHQGGQFKIEKGLDYDPSFKLDRFNFRSNIDIQLNSSLKAFLNVGGYLDKRNMPNAIGTRNDIGSADNSTVAWILASMLEPATTPAPVVPPGYGEASGQVLGALSQLEPAYGKLNRAGYIQQNGTHVTATYGMEQDLGFFTKGLSAKVMMSFDTKAINNLMASRDYEVYHQVIDPNLTGANGEDSIYYVRTGSRDNTPLSLTGAKDYTTLSNFQGYINYQRSFGEHSFTGLILFQKQKQIINHELPFNLIGTAARLSYGYAGKYFFEFDAGYNGSEQFAPGRRFGFFPALSGAWIVSKEKFWKNHDVVSYLKLRGSYGEVGNDRIADRRFLYLDNIQITGGGNFTSLDNGKTVDISLLKNRDLQWEIAKKGNVGIELGLFNSFQLTLDVFNERRNNVLLERGTVPILFGVSSNVLPPVNIGKIENKGFEAVLNYHKMFNNDLSFISRINMSFAKNKILFADEPELPKDYAYRYRQTGYPIGQQWGYIVEGYFVDKDQIDRSPVQNIIGHSTLPGDFKYKNLNDDNVVDEKDLAPIGYPNVPEISFGAAFNLSYKNIDFSVLFQGVTHTSNYYESYGVFANGNYFNRMWDSWTSERASTGKPIRYPRLTTLTSPNEMRNSFFIVDNSYLRLKNMEVGYRLPSNWIRKIGAEEIRFYLNGFNLITWDKLPTDNIDPEQSTSQAYPVVKVYNIGVNIKF